MKCQELVLALFAVYIFGAKLETSEGEGLIERLGNKKAKGMKKAKGNGINGFCGRACRYLNQIILSALGLCRSLLLFQPRGVDLLSVQLNSGGVEKLLLFD